MHSIDVVVHQMLCSSNHTKDLSMITAQSRPNAAKIRNIREGTKKKTNAKSQSCQSQEKKIFQKNAILKEISFKSMLRHRISAKKFAKIENSKSCKRTRWSA